MNNWYLKESNTQLNFSVFGKYLDESKEEPQR